MSHDDLDILWTSPFPLFFTLWLTTLEVLPIVPFKCIMFTLIYYRYGSWIMDIINSGGLFERCLVLVISLCICYYYNIAMRILGYDLVGWFPSLGMVLRVWPYLLWKAYIHVSITWYICLFDLRDWTWFGCCYGFSFGVFWIKSYFTKWCFFEGLVGQVMAYSLSFFILYFLLYFWRMMTYYGGVCNYLGCMCE